MKLNKNKIPLGKEYAFSLYLSNRPSFRTYYKQGLYNLLSGELGENILKNKILKFLEYWKLKFLW